MTDGVELREPFSRPEQQHEADMLGIMIFMATEIMLFGGLFALSLADRVQHPAEYVAASRQLHIFIGAGNTAVLLTSSFTMAAAVVAAKNASKRLCAALLSATALLGLAFMGIKAVEYALEYREGLLPPLGATQGITGPVHALFMDFYLIATGLHAIHLTAGIVLVGILAARVRIGRIPLPGRAVAVEGFGLYWHLVDVIWVFLYPVLYLAR